MNNAYELKTPVAFLIFNRPDTTQRVFDEIRRARPSKLLVVADGPRVDKPGEVEKCQAVRAIIDTVDWPCEVLKNYSDVNLGCKIRVSSGLDWVFEQVEEAIILEDDCLPHPTFFRFCVELLEHYRHDQRIAMISGCNFQFGARRNNDSYYFSKYNHIWGWASWRDRWQGCYDVAMTRWPKIRDEDWIVDMVGSKAEANYWKRIFEDVYQGKIDTWDYQWTFACWLQRRLTILPNTNLISNIGFNNDATHTTVVNKFADMPVSDMHYPLTHPHSIICNLEYDNKTYNNNFRIPLKSRIIAKLRALFSRLPTFA